MTIEEIIAKVDALSPNQYTTEQKIGWLSSLDGKIFHEVILTHMPGDFVYFPPSGYDTDDYELIVQPPYAEDLYTYYLLSRIAEMNAETAKYNQYAALYNAAYSDWTGWYNRTHRPITRGRWKL